MSKDYIKDKRFWKSETLVKYFVIHNQILFRTINKYKVLIKHFDTQIFKANGFNINFLL